MLLLVQKVLLKHMQVQKQKHMPKVVQAGTAVMLQQRQTLEQVQEQKLV
jgi:hypothetical protein